MGTRGLNIFFVTMYYLSNAFHKSFSTIFMYFVTVTNLFLLVGCAYADGSLTPEEAVLTAFARGYGCVQAKNELVRGAMAAVGLSKDEIVKILPKGVHIGCHNSSSSVTITGPEIVTKAFVESLKSKGILAKFVRTFDIALHSEYVHPAAKHMMEFMKNIIKEPKLRSSKWISTSIPSHQKAEDWSKYNCAEYHCNNFCNPVLFDQVFKHIPKNAVVIEVAPHGLLQSILKQDLPETVTNISISNNKDSNNEQFLLSAIGR